MIIPILQITIAIILIILILLQERSAGLSGLFGGEGGGGGFYQTRRGLEKIFFRGTVALAIVFGGLAIVQLFI